MNGRIGYLDLLRGIAIIGVIAIHASAEGSTRAAGFYNFNGTIIWRQLVNFSVPLFLAISGYLMYDRDVSTKRGYLDFLKKHLPRVYLPMLVWSCAYMLFNMYFYKSLLADELTKVLLFRSTGPFYYVCLIMQYYLLLPLLRNMANGRGLLISFIVSISTCVFISYLKRETVLDFPVTVYAYPFTTWMMFFVLGLYVRASGRIGIPNGLCLFLAGASLVLSIIETRFLYAWSGNIRDAMVAMKASSFMYSLFVITFLLNNIRPVAGFKKIIFVGTVSFGIYLTHMLFLPLLGYWAGRIAPGIVGWQVLYQPLLIAGTVGCCLLLAVLLRKLDTNLTGKYLGF